MKQDMRHKHESTWGCQDLTFHDKDVITAICRCIFLWSANIQMHIFIIFVPFVGKINPLIHREVHMIGLWKQPLLYNNQRTWKMTPGKHTSNFELHNATNITYRTFLYESYIQNSTTTRFFYMKKTLITCSTCFVHSHRPTLILILGLHGMWLVNS